MRRFKNVNPTIFIVASLSIASFVIILSSCGREPSNLLRQGQLPIYDFPLFFTEGAAGSVWKVDQDRTKILLVEGLQDPRGLATDRFQNLYIAEYGAGRILKVDPETGVYESIKENLGSPSVIAVDSFGEVYVAEDDTQTIKRVSDDKNFGTYSSVVSALTFGVNDIPIIGLYNNNNVIWGWEESSSTATDVMSPINASIDGTGRVYVAQGDMLEGKVLRFNQKEPGSEGKVVAEGLIGPIGIAVDLVGNIFIIEQGAGRVVLVTFGGDKYAWLSDLSDPQYIGFTQY